MDAVTAMELKLKLDPKVVWKLSEIAEIRGVRIEQVVESLLSFQNSGHKGKVSADQRRETQRLIRRFHTEGLTDSQIGMRIDRVPAHVARVRRELGLPANKRARAA